jgi:5-enolpyruvylshikimate-3-phosphate synthase
MKQLCSLPRFKKFWNQQCASVKWQQLTLVTKQAWSAHSSYAFKSYEDHRIAMACSIFAFKKNITIDNASVVQKSFPNYWHLFLKMAYES